jgi:hypothetical protein
VYVGAAEYERRGVDHKRAICLAYPRVVGIPYWQNDAPETMQVNGLNPPAAFEGIYGPLEGFVEALAMSLPALPLTLARRTPHIGRSHKSPQLMTAKLASPT